MPLKRKEKSEEANKNKSTLISLFKKYNKGEITKIGIKKFFVTVFYRLGYSAELTTLLLVKKARKVSYICYRYLKKIYKEIKIFINKLVDGMLEDIGFPLSRLKASVLNIRQIIKKSKEDDNVHAKQEVKAYVSQGIKKHKSFVPILMSYILPVVCFALMVTIISIGLNESYAIQISLDGQSMGCVDNYNVVTNADNIIKNKLVTLNDEQKWNIEPKVKLVSTKGQEIVDERQLSDQILRASNENIVSATGLYVDGVFHGAVKNPDKIKQAMQSIMDPYLNDNEEKVVTFVQDVSLTDGIFFTETIVDEDELSEKITGLVAGEVWYTVVEGDSPSLIAQKNGLRLSELYNLNPELEGGGLWIGDEILVSQAVPFLQVKEVINEVREVETKHETEQRGNNSMNVGTTKTVQKGENGLNRLTVEVTYIDGIMQGENVINTEVVKEPVTEIIEVGRYIPSVGVMENAGSGQFGWPTGGGVRVSRGFAGQYPAHNGVDIAGPYGTAIVASDSGTVVTAKYTNRGYGVYLVIDHGNGYQTLYGHCSSLLVSPGESVKKGQVIARMGSTGNSTGNHLHFEIKRGNTRYDPYKFW